MVIFMVAVVFLSVSLLRMFHDLLKIIFNCDRGFAIVMALKIESGEASEETLLFSVPRTSQSLPRTRRRLPRTSHSPPRTLQRHSTKKLDSKFGIEPFNLYLFRA